MTGFCRQRCFYVLLFASQLLLSAIGRWIYFEHRDNVIYCIPAHHIENSSLTIPILLDQVRTSLEHQKYLLLGRHFELECNGKRISYRSPNLNVLRTLQFRCMLKIEVVYPNYVVVRDNIYSSPSTEPTFLGEVSPDTEMTSFIASDEFEIEFDFRIFLDGSVRSFNGNKIPVLFLQSDSTEVIVWLDPKKKLEIVHYKSISNAWGKRNVSSILSMGLYRRWFSTIFTTAFNHMYLQIGNRTVANALKVVCNGQTTIGQTERRIFEKGEKVHVLFFKDECAVNGVIRNAALCHRAYHFSFTS